MLFKKKVEDGYSYSIWYYNLEQLFRKWRIKLFGRSKRALTMLLIMQGEKLKHLEKRIENLENNIKEN